MNLFWLENLRGGLRASESPRFFFSLPAFCIAADRLYLVAGVSFHADIFRVFVFLAKAVSLEEHASNHAVVRFGTSWSDSV